MGREIFTRLKEKSINFLLGNFLLNCCKCLKIGVHNGSITSARNMLILHRGLKTDDQYYLFLIYFHCCVGFSLMVKFTTAGEGHVNVALEILNTRCI